MPKKNSLYASESLKLSQCYFKALLQIKSLVKSVKAAKFQKFAKKLQNFISLLIALLSTS